MTAKPFPEKLADALMDEHRIGQLEKDWLGNIVDFHDTTAQELAAFIRKVQQETEAETAKGLMDLDERNAA